MSDGAAKATSAADEADTLKHIGGSQSDRNRKAHRTPEARTLLPTG
jgi:hypothetical protein